MPESTDTIRRAAVSLRGQARRYMPGGRDERFLLAVAAWLESWPHLTGETVADEWRDEWGYAQAVAVAALGERGGGDRD